MAANLLPSFPAKWTPVRVRKTRQNKKLEPPFRFNRNRGSSRSLALIKRTPCEEDPGQELFHLAEQPRRTAFARRHPLQRLASAGGIGGRGSQQLPQLRRGTGVEPAP